MSGIWNVELFSVAFGGLDPYALKRTWSVPITPKTKEDKPRETIYYWLVSWHCCTCSCFFVSQAGKSPGFKSDESQQTCKSG